MGGLQSEVNIYNWAEYTPDGFNENFTQQTGIEVNFNTFETDEGLLQALSKPKSNHDVVVPSAAFAEKLIKEGKFTKLDRSKLPNFNHLNPALMAQLAKIDPNNDYLIPWSWGYTGVGINEKKVKKALGDLPLPTNPYDLVFNPTYTTKLKSCGILFINSPLEVLPAAMQYLGKDISRANPDDFKLAGNVLKKIRPDIKRFGDSIDVRDIADGKFCAFLMWSSDVSLAAEIAKNDQIKMLPGAGVLFFDTLAIPRNAKNLEEAHQWINFSLEPKNAAGMTNDLGYATANQTAIQQGLVTTINNSTDLTADQITSMGVKRLPTSTAALKTMNDVY